jgi:hypothetical protein
MGKENLKKEDCFHYLNLSGATRVRELVLAGRLAVDGQYYCDQKTPIAEVHIPPGGMDLNCYGPGSESCPGFLHK